MPRRFAGHFFCQKILIFARIQILKNKKNEKILTLYHLIIH